MMKRLKKGSTCFLALTVFMSAMVVSNVNAANGVDTKKDCSIEFQIDGGKNQEFEELLKLEVPVNLYKVADITASGSYKTLEVYKGLDLEQVNSETTAAWWEEKTQKAMELVEKEAVEASKTVPITDGNEVAKNLEAGMYLVAAQQVLSEEYAYKFKPYLLSLPNNYYGTEKDDTWVYDVKTGLKPEKEERLGSITINKTVTSFNATLGKATFIFGIEAMKDNKKVYSDVVSMVFDAAGTKSLTIDEIPAGAEVTVTETYSGASYELTTEASKNVTVVADPEEEPGKNAIAVDFVNKYNNSLNGNASVVNHFMVDEKGVWEVNQQFNGEDTQK